MDQWPRVTDQNTTANGRPSAGGLPSAGTVVIANVEEDHGDGRYTLRWNTTKLSVTSNTPLKPGESLILKSEAGEDGRPRLVVQGPALPTSRATGRTVYNAPKLAMTRTLIERMGENQRMAAGAGYNSRGQSVGQGIAASASPEPEPQVSGRELANLIGLMLEPLDDFALGMRIVLEQAQREKELWDEHFDDADDKDEAADKDAHEADNADADTPAADEPVRADRRQAPARPADGRELPKEAELEQPQGQPKTQTRGQQVQPQPTADQPAPDKAQVHEILSQVVRASHVPVGPGTDAALTAETKRHIPDAVADKAAALLLRAAGVEADKTTVAAARALMEHNAPVERQTVQAMTALAQTVPEDEREGLLRAAARLASKNIPLAAPLAAGMADVIQRTAGTKELLAAAASALSDPAIDGEARPLADMAVELLDKMHVDLEQADAAVPFERYVATQGRQTLSTISGLLERAAQTILENSPALAKIDAALTVVLNELHQEIVNEAAPQTPTAPSAQQPQPAAQPPGQVQVMPAVPGAPMPQPQAGQPVPQVPIQPVQAQTAPQPMPSGPAPAVPQGQTPVLPQGQAQVMPAVPGAQMPQPQAGQPVPQAPVQQGQAQTAPQPMPTGPTPAAPEGQTFVQPQGQPPVAPQVQEFVPPQQMPQGQAVPLMPNTYGPVVPQGQPFVPAPQAQGQAPVLPQAEPMQAVPDAQMPQPQAGQPVPQVPVQLGQPQMAPQPMPSSPAPAAPQGQTPVLPQGQPPVAPQVQEFVPPQQMPQGQAVPLMPNTYGPAVPQGQTLAPAPQAQEQAFVQPQGQMPVPPQAQPQAMLQPQAGQPVPQAPVQQGQAQTAPQPMPTGPTPAAPEGQTFVQPQPVPQGQPPVAPQVQAFVPTQPMPQGQAVPLMPNTYGPAVPQMQMQPMPPGQVQAMPAVPDAQMPQPQAGQPAPQAPVQLGQPQTAPQPMPTGPIPAAPEGQTFVQPQGQPPVAPQVQEFVPPQPMPQGQAVPLMPNTYGPAVPQGQALAPAPQAQEQAFVQPQGQMPVPPQAQPQTMPQPQAGQPVPQAPIQPGQPQTAPQPMPTGPAPAAPQGHPTAEHAAPPAGAARHNPYAAAARRYGPNAGINAYVNANTMITRESVIAHFGPMPKVVTIDSPAQQMQSPSAQPQQPTQPAQPQAQTPAPAQPQPQAQPTVAVPTPQSAHAPVPDSAVQQPQAAVPQPAPAPQSSAPQVAPAQTAPSQGYEPAPQQGQAHPQSTVPQPQGGTRTELGQMKEQALEYSDRPQTPGANRPEIELLKPNGIIDKFLSSAGKKADPQTKHQAEQVVRNLLSDDPEVVQKTAQELPRREKPVLREAAARLVETERELVQHDVRLTKLSQASAAVRDLGRQQLAVKAENIASQDRDMPVMLAEVPFKLGDGGGNGRMQMFYRKSKSKQEGWTSRVILDLNTTALGPVLGDMRFFGQDMVLNMFVEKDDAAGFLNREAEQLVKNVESKGFRLKARFMVFPPPDAGQAMPQPPVAQPLRSASGRLDTRV